MKRCVFLLVISILLGSCSFKDKEGRHKYSKDVEDRIKQVESNLAGWVQTGSGDKWSLISRMRKYGVNGLSIAVVHDYKIEWARGYGYADLSEKREVNTSTLFQAASISKSLNSLGVLKLVQEGKLNLDADINDYLDSWKFPYDEKSNNRKITLTNLLSHTGGLSIHGFPGYAAGEDLPSLIQILDGLKPANTEAVRSVEEPGKSVIYSGGGITISQLIITDITHQPYDLFMEKNVLKPLGMSSSFFTQPPPDRWKKLLATGYKNNGNEVAGKYHIYPEQAAAGLWTNPTDLCKYLIETQLSYKGESSKVLTPEMSKIRLKTILEDAALGSFVNSRVTGSYKYFNHNGGNDGFSCTAIGCLNSGDGVVIMTNSDNASILEEIANSVAYVYKWKDYYLPEIKNVINVEKAVLKTYAGKYDNAGSQYEITMSDSGLILNPFGNVHWQLYFTSDSDFFIRENKGNLKFRTGKDNMVKGIVINGSLAKKLE
jgi:CubicO group peptidase (beta-lactamase class C family)